MGIRLNPRPWRSTVLTFKRQLNKSYVCLNPRPWRSTVLTEQAASEALAKLSQSASLAEYSTDYCSSSGSRQNESQSASLAEYSTDGKWESRKPFEVSQSASLAEYSTDSQKKMKPN